MKTLLSAVVLATLSIAAAPVFAQEPAGNQIVVDARFAEQYGVDVPLPFEITIPLIEGQNVYYKPAPGGTGILKVTFTTAEDQVRSNIQMIPLTIDMAPIEERIQAARGLLQQALETSIPDLERSEVLIIQQFEMGPYTAAEVVAKYDGGDNGLIIFRAVVIPDPNSVNGLLVTMHTVVKNNEMAVITDILEFEAAQALNSIRFR